MSGPPRFEQVRVRLPPLAEIIGPVMFTCSGATKKNKYSSFRTVIGFQLIFKSNNFHVKQFSYCQAVLVKTANIIVKQV